MAPPRTVPANSPYYYGGGGTRPTLPPAPPRAPVSSPDTTPPLKAPPFRPPGQAPQKPLWAMTPNELQALAFKQAQSYFQPLLGELSQQERSMADEYAAAQAGLTELLKAMQGNISEWGGPDAGAAAGFLANEGQLQFLNAFKDQQKSLSELRMERAKLKGQIPQEAQKILSDYYDQQEKYFKANKPSLRNFGGSVYAVDPNDPTKWTLVRKGEAKKQVVSLPLSKALGVWVDSSGNPISGITKPVPAPDADTPTVSLGMSDRMGYWSDSSGHPIAGLPPYQRKKATTKPVSAATLRSAQQAANAAVGPYLSTVPGAPPLNMAQVRKKVDAFNKRMVAAGRKEFADHPVTVDMLPTLDPAQLAQIGVTPNKDYMSPDRTYMTLVQEYGIPARKAWEMVRKQRPWWGKGYWDNPKGEAPSSGASLPLRTPFTGGSEFMVVDAEGAPGPNGQRYHGAKDWFAPAGSAVSAPVTGTVVDVQESRGSSGQVYGGVVKVQGSDGRVYVFRHVNPAGVAVGKKVQAGQKIASVSPWTDGKTHAHVEVWKTLDGGYNISNMIDPSEVFGESGTSHNVSYKAPETPQGARQTAFRLASKTYKWGDKELSALDQLWEKESGWDYTAKNGDSGAAGIPQALGHTLPADYASNPVTQIKWGLKYIKQRYRTPSRAWAFWQATVNRNAALAPPDLRGVAEYWISRGYAGY